MIENIAGGTTHYHLAANLRNEGQIANLPLAFRCGDPCCGGWRWHPSGSCGVIP